MRIKTLARHHVRCAWQVNLHDVLHYGNDLGGTSNRPPPSHLGEGIIQRVRHHAGGETSGRRLVWIFGDVSLPVF
jgi:hypothetical protein